MKNLGGRPPITYIGEVHTRDPEEAKKLIIRTLEETGGSHVATARVLGCSRPHINHLIRKLGLRGLPREIKNRLRNRFRLPRHIGD